jgi:hypothetical protein
MLSFSLAFLGHMHRLPPLGFEHSPSAALNGHPPRDEAFCRGQFILSSMPSTEVEALLHVSQASGCPRWWWLALQLVGCLSQQLIHTDTYDYLTHVQLRCADVTAKTRKLSPVKSSFVRSAMQSQLSRLRRARIAARTRHTQVVSPR